MCQVWCVILYNNHSGLCVYYAPGRHFTYTNSFSAQTNISQYRSISQQRKQQFRVEATSLLKVIQLECGKAGFELGGGSCEKPMREYAASIGHCT